jgi:hypothetical protein
VFYTKTDHNVPRNYILLWNHIEEVSFPINTSTLEEAMLNSMIMHFYMATAQKICKLHQVSSIPKKSIHNHSVSHNQGMSNSS